MDMRTKPALLPLGIHLGLEMDAYLADPGLGSTDLKRLYYDPTSYWYNSHMNPSRPLRKSTPQQERGTAMHKLLYEGEAAFDRLYVRGPDQECMTTAEKSATTKEANALAAKAGKTCLKAPDYDQIAIATAMITKNQKLATVFSGGLSEVSIFWERVDKGGESIRLKARMDYLKPRGVGDLKGVANQHDIDFRQACRNAIANYRYDLQSSHYMEARSVVRQLIYDGIIYKGMSAPNNDELTTLKKIAASPEYAWQWIFYQSEGAPITWSKILTPDRVDPRTGEVKTGNPILENARNHIELALQKYKAFRAEFGETMWLLLDEPTELYMDEMPAYFAR